MEVKKRKLEYINPASMMDMSDASIPPATDDPSFNPDAEESMAQLDAEEDKNFFSRYSLSKTFQ